MPFLTTPFLFLAASAFVTAYAPGTTHLHLHTPRVIGPHMAAAEGALGSLRLALQRLETRAMIERKWAAESVAAAEAAAQERVAAAIQALA